MTTCDRYHRQRCRKVSLNSKALSLCSTASADFRKISDGDLPRLLESLVTSEFRSSVCDDLYLLWRCDVRNEHVKCHFSSSSPSSSLQKNDAYSMSACEQMGSSPQAERLFGCKFDSITSPTARQSRMQCHRPPFYEAAQSVHARSSQRSLLHCGSHAKV